MNPILFAGLLVAGAGLILGLILAVFSKIMAVPVDQRQQDLRALLPGANCGACGYNTCDGYSKVLADGKEDNSSLCKPGGKQTASDLAEYLGTDMDAMEITTAMVMCQGSNDKTQKRADYQGVKSCKMAVLVEGGDQACQFGCLGYGDCEAVCAYDAIHVINGVAVVDPAKCTSCTMCIQTCPKGIIELLPMGKDTSMVLCKNEDKGGQANKVCQVSCIACQKCVKSCPVQCIEIRNNRAIIDYAACTNCGNCQEVCPHDCILSLSAGSGVN